MAGGSGIAARLRADLVWASGLARLTELRGNGRSGLIGFDRVRPPSRAAFQPQCFDISPAGLDRVIRALKRWRVDIVSIDEACARLAETSRHRFVSLSLNGAYHDVAASARPVLASHGVPYAVYVPSAFPDGIAELWWLALEAVIARHARISLVIANTETVFAVDGDFAKQQLYETLYTWMRGLPPVAASHAIHDLCARYDVDLRALANDVSITWDDIMQLAADPSVTICSATVNYPVLAKLNDDAARREIAMGRAVLETALQRPVRHFAFPFGDPASFNGKHVEMAGHAGFTSAVTANSGMLNADAQMHRLPRLVWTRCMTLRGLRVRLAGY